MIQTLVATQSGLYVDRDEALQGRDVSALSRDGAWAIVDGRELWHYRGSWDLAARSLEFDLRCVAPAGEGVYVGTAGAHLLRLAGDGLEVIDAFEDVDGHDQWFTPWGGPPDVRSIAVGAEGELYVNVHVGGIVKGSDDAWEPTIDIGVDVHEVRHAGQLVVAACAIGLAETGDGGYAWNYDDDGLHARYARAVAVGDEYLFLSVSHGPRGGDAAVYRQPCDGSTTFERCDLPSFADNIDTGCLDARGPVVAFGTAQGELYRSSDNGSTWEVSAEGLPPIRSVVLTGRGDA